MELKVEQSKNADNLRVHYQDLEGRYAVTDRSTDYASLVVPTGNDLQPIHRWFRYKEAYSFQLLDRLLKDASDETRGGVRLIDPFVGSGTSIVSALNRKSDAPCHLTGIERNPFVATVARAKSAAVLLGRDLTRQIEVEREPFMRRYSQFMRGWKSLNTESSTLNNADYFPRGHVRSLLALGKAAALIANDNVRAIYQTCVASAIEPSGRLRRDGRALRFVPGRQLTSPMTAFELALGELSEDVSASDAAMEGSFAQVVDGDSRTELRRFQGNDYEWSVFSPPYPNNIDYTEVYKVEGWVLGFYQNATDVRQQRLSTLRSHPSVLFPDIYEAGGDAATLKQLDELLAPIRALIPVDRYERGRNQLVRGYFVDMLNVFVGLHGALRSGGRVACVVGNSVHGAGEGMFVIASDLLLAAVGELAGLEVDEIRVARELRRRGRGMARVRESVVMLRKTSGEPMASV